MKLSFLLLVCFFLSIVFIIPNASAKVVGQCVNCHTMHNSQNASGMVHMGTGAGWTGSGLGGGTSSNPQPQLLVSDCVGCHTSTTNATIITRGDSRIPIVFNTVVPTNPLAGGNFYWVAQPGGDAYGHNVRGISARDATLLTAPGTVGCGGCHEALTYADYSVAAENDKNGCQGCHYTVRHHGSDPAGSPVGEAGGYYRFLNTREGHDPVGGGGVQGIEDPNWEQTPTASTHNAYYAGTTRADGESPQSMGQYCSGCHYQFHSPGMDGWSWWGVDNGGYGTDPWLRHPSDHPIPNSGEYRNFTTYSPTYPVARPEATLTGFDVTKVRLGTDMVFCLSCHRAHGSPYPDMLRWEYNMVTATTGATAGKGCFKCHSYKDDATDVVAR